MGLLLSPDLPVQDGQPPLLEGRAAVPYCYSGKNMLSIKDYDGHVEDEQKRLKALKGASHPIWVENWRELGELWQNDDILRIRKIGEKFKEYLFSCGIETVGALKGMTDERIAAINRESPREATFWLRWKNIARPQGEFLESGSLTVHAAR